MASSRDRFSMDFSGVFLCHCRYESVCVCVCVSSFFTAEYHTYKGDTLPGIRYRDTHTNCLLPLNCGYYQYCQNPSVFRSSYPLDKNGGVFHNLSLDFPPSNTRVVAESARMNLFQNDGWNGPGGAVSFSPRIPMPRINTQPTAVGDPNITVEEEGQSAGLTGVAGTGYPAPPRDWPNAGSSDEDDAESARPQWEQAPAPDISVCQEFVYEPAAAPRMHPPTAGGESTATEEGGTVHRRHAERPPTLSGFETDQEQEPPEIGRSDVGTEDSLVQQIMGDVDRGYESPYFAAGQDVGGEGEESEGPARKRMRHESPPRSPSRPPGADMTALRSLRDVDGAAGVGAFGVGDDDSGGFTISTDCCNQSDGSPLYDSTVGEVVSGDLTRFWCFGCQWGAHNHRPVDSEKIADLANCFMNLILNGSTTLENTSRIVSDMYRRTIQEPARLQGQHLPDWPPAVVKRHIENIMEPRVVNSLLIRKNLALLDRVFGNAVRYDTRSGREEVNMQACNMWCRLLRETREMYRQVPKESFGYNQHFRAESWSGGTLVHPTRVQRSSGSGDSNGGADIRRYVLGSGVVDAGAPRGPGNDDELVARPVGNTLSSESGAGF